MNVAGAWSLHPCTANQFTAPLPVTPPGVAVTAFTGPGGRTLLATASLDETVRIWDPATGTPVGGPREGHARAVTAATIFAGPDGHTLLLTGSTDQTVRIWDPNRATCLEVISVARPVYAVTALGDDDLIVGLDDGWARLRLPELRGAPNTD